MQWILNMKNITLLMHSNLHMNGNAIFPGKQEICSTELSFFTDFAGIGNDPREDRYFNILSQAKKYDGDGEFVRYWIPELSKLPANLIHQPNLLTIDQLQELEIEDLNYPQPIIDVSKWN